MIRHTNLGSTTFAQNRALHQLILNQEITFAGNRRLKIYGHLHCRAGKRMKAKNRVFFKNETEAQAFGYRPCAICMPEAYVNWKLSQVSTSKKS